MNVSGIKENTTLAMETLVAHKFRAALTILGVFIGVLVIVAMAAVLNGFRQSVLDNAESFGTRNVYIWRYPFIMTTKPSAEILNRKPLSLEDSQAIEREVPAVEHVYAGIVYDIPMPGEVPLVPPEVRYRDRSMIRSQLIGNYPVAELVM
ncbi:MAG TPA: ABC transporter permease, partial [Blastocatellia bacterium]|nr:ABC transporter permease [Blastocatellia bacterium]